MPSRSSHARAIIEGPKTPNTKWKRDEVLNCFSDPSWISHYSNFCTSRRASTLDPSVLAIQKLLGTRWIQARFSRIRLQHSAQKPFEQTQAIRIQAEHAGTELERWILLTPRGSQQTITIIGNPNDVQYRKLQASLRTLKLEDDLGAQKLLTDEWLAKTQLSEIKSRPEKSRRPELEFIQRLLIARLTLDPKSIDTVFHLAGVTSIMGQSNDSDLLLESMNHYAQDIAPSHPYTLQIQRLKKGQHHQASL